MEAEGKGQDEFGFVLMELLWDLFLWDISNTLSCLPVGCGEDPHATSLPLPLPSTFATTIYSGHVYRFLEPLFLRQYVPLFLAYHAVLDHSGATLRGLKNSHFQLDP